MRTLEEQARWISALEEQAGLQARLCRLQAQSMSAGALIVIRIA